MTLVTAIDLMDAAGFAFRGAFYPNAQDHVPESLLAGGKGTVLLFGNIGSSMWPAFSKGRIDEPDAMDQWTRRTVEKLVPGLTEAIGPSAALFPFGSPPHHPFQKWAMRAGSVFSSPLGPLIHPVYGMWHAYRTAIVCSSVLDIEVRKKVSSPCDSCVDKPCLSTCPVSAFGPDGLDLVACANHMASDLGKDCLSGNCLARRACPIGQDYIYSSEQSRFHMQIFKDKYATI